MKSLLLKVVAPLLLVFFVFGFIQSVDAAFPGKQNQKEIVVKSESDATQQNQAKQTSKSESDDDIILLVILAFLLPPLAVYLKYNEAGKPFIVNVILTLLCGLPGVIHALVHVLRK
ncbi:MAG: YqaE/Pmp3 family membrane protein [Bacteroidales bacterium]|nr:YqaE/Pmp3 family membrane protein [Bacteroidales bacterium]